MAIEHDFFGLLESGPDGSIFWSENVELGDQTVTVDLTAPDQDDVSRGGARRGRRPDLLDRDDRPQRPQRHGGGARRPHQRGDRVHPAAAGELGDELERLLVDISGDVHIDIIRSLQLMSMTILADEHGGADPFAVLEYALDPGRDRRRAAGEPRLGRRCAVGDQRRLNGRRHHPAASVQLAGPGLSHRLSVSRYAACGRYSTTWPFAQAVTPPARTPRRRDVLREVREVGGDVAALRDHRLRPEPPGAIGRAHERAGEHAEEADALRLLLELDELLRLDPAGDGQMPRRRPQVLRDRDDVGARIVQVLQRLRRPLPALRPCRGSGSTS